MKWLALTAMLVIGCTSAPKVCNTCTEAGAACTTEDASAYGWITCGAAQVFRTCTCSGGTWDCGECPEAGTDAGVD